MILSIVQDRERGVRLGVDRYLTKPIDTDLLFREVGALHRAADVAQARARRGRGRLDREDADRRADRARLQRDRGARRRTASRRPWRCSPTSSCSTRCPRRDRTPSRCCVSRRGWRTSSSSSTSKEPREPDDPDRGRRSPPPDADPAGAGGPRRRGRRAADGLERRGGAGRHRVGEAEPRVPRRDDAEAQRLRRVPPRQARPRA